MVLLATNCIPVVVNHLLMAFYAVRTPHNCRVPDDFIGNKSSLLPPGESKFGFAQCEMYVDSDNHSLGTTPCIHGYEFHFQDDKEWNIVAEVGCLFEFCGKSNHINSAPMFYYNAEYCSKVYRTLPYKKMSKFRSLRKLRERKLRLRQKKKKRPAPRRARCGGEISPQPLGFALQFFTSVPNFLVRNYSGDWCATAPSSPPW